MHRARASFPRPLRRFVHILCVGMLAASSASAGEWTGWRGTDGSGVSHESGFPLVWDQDSGNVAWRVELAGTGLSSPVASGGRVFVTSASDVQGSLWIHDWLGVLLLAAAGGLLLARAPYLGSSAERGGVHRHQARPMGRPLRLLYAAIFAGLACGVAITLTNDFDVLAAQTLTRALPGTLAVLVFVAWIPAANPGLSGLAIPVLLAGVIGLHQIDLPARYPFGGTIVLLSAAMLVLAGDRPGRGRLDLAQRVARADRALLLFASLAFLFTASAATLFPEHYWAKSVPAHVWFRSGLIALLGCICVLGCVRDGSRLRRLGLLAFLGAVTLLFFGAPRNSYGQPWPLPNRLAATVPALFAGAWMLFAFRSARAVSRQAPRRAGALTACLCLVATAFTFYRANFVQGQMQTRHQVQAFDLESGEHLWTSSVSASPTGSLGSYRTSHATPTPRVEGGHVFVHFGASTACLDVDGRLLWVREHPDFIAHAVFGAGSSPVLTRQAVVIVQEREKGPEHRSSRITAFDRATGRTLWCVEPEEARSSYGTPLVVDHGGGEDVRQRLVLATWHGVVCYDASSGERLWFVELPVEEVVTSLVRSPDGLFLSGGCVKGLTAALAWPAAPAALAPGVAERDERTEGKGREEPPEILWKSRRSTPSCASPLFYRGRLFTLTQTGVMSCIEPESGAVLWRERIDGGDFYASPVAAEGRLYVIDAQGSTTVLAAADELRVLSRAHLDEEVFASPALARGRLLIRTASELTCIAGSTSGAVLAADVRPPAPGSPSH